MKTRALLLASAVLRLPARAHALKTTVDSLDDLPEALHAEYVQQGDKFVLQVEGMKSQSDFDRVNSALANERRDHGALKSRVTQHFGTRPFEEVVTDLDKIEEYKTAAEGKLDEAALDKIVQGRVRTALAPVERERDGFKAKVGELEGTVGELTTKEKNRLIRDKARDAGVAAKIRPEAMDDFLLLAERVLEVRDDDNEVVVKDNVGYTPGVQPAVLLADLQPKRPHWWGDSTGGGAQGNRGGAPSGANPFTHEGWNMTKQGELVRTDPAKAEQMAKAAGTTVGGQRPAPKK